MIKINPNDIIDEDAPFLNKEILCNIFSIISSKCLYDIKGMIIQNIKDKRFYLLSNDIGLDGYGHSPNPNYKYSYVLTDKPFNVSDGKLEILKFETEWIW